MLRLIKSGSVVSLVSPGSSFSVDGIHVSPAVAGWSFGDYALEPEPEPEPEPEAPETLADQAPVSMPQMRAALILQGVITRAEGVAWAAGALPAPIAGRIAQLPEPEAIVAEQRALGSSMVYPGDPFVGQLAELMGKSEEDMISLFKLARSL